ncbi:MAG TPA: hypothetical protein VGJ81_00710 [Thermoanaerobaculia bacterium]|jgi:hypothetical protein
MAPPRRTPREPLSPLDEYLAVQHILLEDAYPEITRPESPRDAAD